MIKMGFGAELFAPYGRSSLSGAYNRRVSGFATSLHRSNPRYARISDTRQPLSAIAYPLENCLKLFTFYCQHSELTPQ